MDLLLDRGLITPAQLAAAVERRKREGVRIDRALVQSGAIGEYPFLKVIGEQLGLEVVELTEQSVEPEILRQLPAKLMYRRALVPLRRENGTLIVATHDPLDLSALDELRLLTGLEIQPVLAPEDDIRKVIKAHLGVAGDTIDELMKERASSDAEGVTVTGGGEDLLQMAQEASVIKLVNEIFLEAIREGASDIHVEPYEQDLHVRYRIDGVLHDASMSANIRQLQAAIISRIKILANLNIAEKRLPQDGRIKFQVGGRQIDVRVSVIPMLFGEGVVMRILDRSQVQFTLTQLGMEEDTFQTFRELVDRPHGMVLVTGPTGSGKTTTLYAALSAVVNSEIKVLTIEDPVEYHLDGVNQIQVHSSVGLSFARGLRSVLRHDPDVIMIGEIRDLETAEAAIQAALTGHLVLSTLHTNDAASAATRLIDMQVEPFLVASTLMASLAQRLVRRICTQCGTDVDLAHQNLPADFIVPPGAKLRHGAGCRVCHHTGYKGRTGLYELLVLDEPCQELIMRRATATELIRQAKLSGLRLLREDGWHKVLKGITTAEEVVRATRL